MALLFSSGGGRLGNQLLNYIHLKAISLGHKLNVEKINDSYLRSKGISLKFKIESNLVNWRISNNSQKKNLFYELLIKLYVILVHSYYHINPFYKSYIIGSFNCHPKFLLGKHLGNKFSSSDILEEASIHNIVLSGWGLRDWELVFRYRNLITKQLLKVVDEFISLEKNLILEKFLFLHIRRTDFLAVEQFRDINFSDNNWVIAIKKLCFEKGIRKVIIFSDSKISNQFIENLQIDGIKIDIPLENSKQTFLELFIYYISKASFVMCNASTLSLSMSFLFHEEIYLPTFKKDFQKINIREAHLKYPTCLNWN